MVHFEPTAMASKNSLKYQKDKYATNISIVDSKLVQLTIIFVATVHASRQLLAQSLL